MDRHNVQCMAPNTPLPTHIRRVPSLQPNNIPKSDGSYIAK
ncbi:MAG: hypothetical protein ACTHMI_12970 [Mucilaginibacter sp.]